MLDPLEEQPRAKTHGRIGLRTADGRFYPLFSRDYRGSKRIVLTTADPQQRVAHLEFFVEGEAGAGAVQRLGHLRLTWPSAATTQKREVVLIAAIDDRNEFTAEASSGQTTKRLSAQIGRPKRVDAVLEVTPAATTLRELVMGGYLDALEGGTRAAMEGFSAGRLPLEVFQYASAATLPLSPVAPDLQRIRELMEAGELAPATIDFLARVLQGMLRHSDDHVTRFASEALDHLQSLLLARIEAVRPLRHQPAEALELAGDLRLMAAVTSHVPVVSRTYLWEAYDAIQPLDDPQQLDAAGFRTVLDVLLALNLTHSARQLLDARMAVDPVSSRFCAAVEFRANSYAATALAVIEFADGPHSNRDSRRLRDFWLGQPGHSERPRVKPDAHG